MISISCKRNADKYYDSEMSASISVTNPLEVAYENALIEIDINSFVFVIGVSPK